MSDAAMAILAPDKEVPVRGGTEMVVVREMTWRDAKTFIEKLVAQANVFLNVDAAGAVQIDRAKLIGVLMAGLGESLVLAATGKDAEWLAGLPMKDTFALLEAAAELNVHPEMVTNMGNLIGRLRAVVKTKAT